MNTRRSFLRRSALLTASAASLAFATLAAGPAAAQAGPDKIRIGWAVAKTGPNAPGVATTVLPNYKLWVEEINAAGGIQLKSGKRVPVEVVEYDDRSSSEEAVRAIERLVTQDKVDFILPPWGTGTNLAVGPTFHKHGYPLLAATAVTDRAPDLVKRWPNAFFFLGTGHGYGEALVSYLEQERKAGKIGTKVAMMSVADGFGVDLGGAARKVVAKHGFELVYDKTYPVGTQDLSPMLNEIKALAPDVFIAFSYPPDTLGITDQAKVIGFNPKVFYTGVGTQFPLYKNKFGANVDGVMSLGGIDADDPAVQAYFRRHKEVTGQEPDRFASPIVWVSLQMLQQAIERVGVDRAAVSKELAGGTFDTILGQVKLVDRQWPKLWWVGQWQDGEFRGIAPTDRAGARPAVIPKPAWKP
ncbi:ABC transporter substrate-binding protein [Azoarcus sp. TTM-91]|uniref:amino acid ABC transporter substrate-binding protein n=1 Tax=Azoarcus sp. TTM-91 TaxID=2691581 RepID=UPI00145F6941|nr:amino acid ABC transporter substrate-binding protein [Azoarcus sp. TTM-91]NMG33701.1 ABC transporter substrate-binding protein [Azoarcus sp. TTM-91]